MAPPRNRRPGFSRRAQYGLFLSYVVAIGGALIAVVLIALSQLNAPAYSALRGAVREVTAPISASLGGVRRGITGVPSGIGQYFGVVSENQRLKKQLRQSGDLVQRARTLGRENARLRRLLQLRDRDPKTVAAARLVSSSPGSTRRYAVLYAGSRQGVRKGQPVRGPEGLIGRVLETSPNTARVLLILDPESIVPVQRTRDGLPAIAVGRGDGLLDIRSADMANAPFLAGDAFVTSGTGGIYPPNIPVGRVTRNSRDSAIARPFAGPDSVDFALVQQIFMPEAPPEPEPTGEASDQPS
ncbi:rod shape-determining protein MreC [Stakelama marina]|uniref:Cell shape-determining protein MreC n=1 Tax=Stakelama marina TaxID=2826939 RepID=A0A8T4IHF4_9SPHN|nr:rod shape-determining protein MreC [Stakelama marina]MBR0551729.1 rod shape-determining protein MreC [Stakelama marina]